MTANDIAQALSARSSGDGWIARCPSHDDKRPSLSIRAAEDGKILVRCHAGCDQQRVIDALFARGLWPKSNQTQHRIFQPYRHYPKIARSDAECAKRSKAALEVWQAAVPSRGTPVEFYLRARGITITPPSSIRFHAGLKHPSGGIWPTMIALVTRGNDGEPLAIHRTYLSHNGRCKAPVEPTKMMLGPCKGGTVRLAPFCDVLMVGEGIETCLSAMQATEIPAWAALSTSGMCALDLPINVSNIIILADGDDPGEAAAQNAALGWIREGRQVRIARPPRGKDFNDLLLGESSVYFRSAP